MKALKSGYQNWWRERAWLSLKDCHALENEPWTFFTKIYLTLTKTNLFQFSF